MASSMFLTRVELYGAHHSGDEYRRMHLAMQAKKFHRVIDANNGANYHLPPAEYYSFGNVTIDQVVELAKAAARSIGYIPWPGTLGSVRHCAVLVAEAPTMRWDGLKAAPTVLASAALRRSA